MATLSRVFRFIHHCHWPGPRSLATTYGVSVDVLSFGYLDVSVPRVRFLPLFYSKVRYLVTISGNPDCSLLNNLHSPDIQGGFPHSEIHGSKLIRSSPRLIAAYHVLLRLCMPRHPPNALNSLLRSHCLCSSIVASKGSNDLITFYNQATS